MSKIDPRLQALLDKDAIRDLNMRYLRGLDRMDEALLRGTYWEDATDDRGFMSGTADDFCAFALKYLRKHHANHHLMGQVDIDLEGDIAFGEVYFIAFHRIEDKGDEKDFIVWGRYMGRYEKRGETWKIAHRKEINDACRLVPASDEWFRNSQDALKGGRTDDLSYQRDLLRRA